MTHAVPEAAAARETRTVLPIVDTDSHYAEDIGILAQYMDEFWQKRFATGQVERYLPTALEDRWVEGRIQRPAEDYAAAGYLYKVDEAGSVGPREAILRAMKRLGISATLLVPNKLVMLGHLSSRDIAVAICNAYIDYHLDQVVDPANGIYTMPIVTWHEPDAAAALIERVGNHPAVVGVCMTTSHAMPPWGDVRYNVIYETAQRLGLPIILHGDSGQTLIEHGAIADGLQRAIEGHSLGFLVSNQVQLTSMVLQGVAVRFPKLKFVFLESGVFYVPLMMYRLDEYFRKRRSEAPLLQDLPSEYMKRYFYFGTQPLEAPHDQRFLEMVFDMAEGRSRFVFASDYPHWDYDDPEVIRRLRFLSPVEKSQVMAGTALEIFPFAKGGLQPWHRTVLEQLKTLRQATS